MTGPIQSSTRVSPRPSTDLASSASRSDPKDPTHTSASRLPGIGHPNISKNSRSTAGTSASSLRSPVPKSAGHSQPPVPVEGARPQRRLSTASLSGFDRAVLQDQIGGTSYAETRRRQLSEIPGADHVAEQYGLMTIKELDDFDQRPGLRFENDLSSIYQRNRPSEKLDELCKKVFVAKARPSDLDPEITKRNLVFVNSDRAFDKLNRYLGKDLQDEIRKQRKLGHGLVPVTIKKEEHIPTFQRVIAHLGGQVSLYQVCKLAHPPKTGPAAASSPGSAEPLLAELDDSIAAMREVPATHASKALMDCSADLLEGLQETLRAAGTHHPVVDNALEALAMVAKAMGRLTHDSPRLFSAYQAMMDEMHVILATVHPYEESDYKAAAAVADKARTGGALGKAQRETYLFSSGMDAMTNCIQLAQSISGGLGVSHLSAAQSADQRPDYYEVGAALLPWEHAKANKDVVITTLRPSTPRKQGADDSEGDWNPDRMLAELKVKLDARKAGGKPLVLILDTAIEAPGDMEKVHKALSEYVDKDQLLILEGKSLVKYPALGSAKMDAGEMSVTGSPALMEQVKGSLDRVGHWERDVGWMKNDESQLMTHMRKYGHRSEFALFDQAAKNMAFVERTCFRSEKVAGAEGSAKGPAAGPRRHPGFDRSMDDAPLALLLHTKAEEVPDSEKVRFQLERSGGVGFKPKHVLKGKLPFSDVKEVSLSKNQVLSASLRTRDSFAFMESSMMLIPATADAPNSTRISFGQESRPELIEKFHAAGYIVQHKEYTPAIALAQAEKAAADSVRILLEQAPLGSWAREALAVLRSRSTHPDSQALRSLEENIDGLDSLGPGAQATLRTRLAAALGKSDASSGTLLADRLHLTSAVAAAGIEPVSDEVEEAGLASNKVASTAIALGDMLGELEALPGAALDKYKFRKEFDALYAGLVDSGMQGVSPSARQRIVASWARVHFQDAVLKGGPAEQGSAVGQLLQQAALLAYEEDKSGLLSKMPDAVFARLPAAQQDQLVRGLLPSPGSAVRTAFIDRQAEAEPSSAKARACQRLA